MGLHLIGFLRALSFGGLVGSGIVIIVSLLYPQLFVGHLNFESMIVFGGLLGAAAHRVFDSLIVRGLLYPIGRFVSYYGKLVQLELLQRRGIVSGDMCHKIRNTLTVDYFVERNSNDVGGKLLPPE